MTDLRRRPRQRRIRAGLGEQQPDQPKSANRDRCLTPERDTATEVINRIARERSAERGADTYRNAKPRLNRPVPRMTSATTSGRITPRTAAQTPSRTCTASALGHFRGRGIFVVRIGGGQLKFSFDFIISLRSASERAERSTLGKKRPGMRNRGPGRGLDLRPSGNRILGPALRQGGRSA